MMHYDVYLHKGYPIATGVVEGTCGSLVKDQGIPAAGVLFSGFPPPLPSRGAGRSFPFLLREDVFSENASFL